MRVVAVLVGVQILTEVAQVTAPVSGTVLSWVLRALVAVALVVAAAGAARGRRGATVVGLSALGCVLSVQVVTLSQPVRLLLYGVDAAVTDWLPGMLVSLLIVTASGAAVVVTIRSGATRYRARPGRSVAASIALVITLLIAVLGEAACLLAALGSAAPGLVLEVPLPAANLVLAAAALVLIPWLWRGVGWARPLALVVAGGHVLAIGGVVAYGITGGVMTIAVAEVDGFVRWIIRPFETLAAASTIALLARSSLKPG